jgi:hypothetical protein
MTDQELQNKILELESKIKTLEANYAKHQHDSLDGTNTLKKSIKLEKDQELRTGFSTQMTLDDGVTSGQMDYGLSVGPDDGRTGLVNKADLLQIDYLHQLSTALSFMIGRRTPVVSSSLTGSKFSVSSGGNTITIKGFNFETNELAGALINIFNSAGTFVECKTIASNTATVVTITGTWGATTNNGIFDIYNPVYMGAAQYIWQRFYTQEGTAGGIRFGVGVTAGGQNGLLYMDSAGDLYWKNKAGSASQLSAPTGVSGEYYVSDSSGGAVTRKLTFTNGILTSES